MPPVFAPQMRQGATLRGDACQFRVWAPRARQVTLRLVGGGDYTMQREDSGVFTATIPARAGDRYFYIVDRGKPLPDPVSRLLPVGVHGPTEIVDADAFRWTDDHWRGLDLRDYILYELHVGAFSPSGTFDGVIERLDYLASLGVSVLEIMPVAAFPGTRNWGYDGASPYAVQASYGGPEGLKRLVDAAHRAGMAVMLDVVYNHLGPEGNYLAQFGPYYTARHHTPWGDAINYDDADAAPVRQYFVDNALYWVREYHLDGLRLDATQTIRDESAKHIVQEIAESVHALGRESGRRVCVICETDENDARYLLPPPQGFGVDAVWSDDFHHALHTLLTPERDGYYQDFGRGEQLARALEEGFGFQGEPFNFWGGRPRGTSSKGLPLYRHVIATQNHDQTGNRARGERLTSLAPRGARKLAAALLLLAPHTPLLFMGQEYDEDAPFQFFSDYGDPALQEAVREGRRKEFAEFDWIEVPDPQDPQTLERSKLKWKVDFGSDRQRECAEMLEWYRRLIELRKRLIIPGERTCAAQWRDGSMVLQVPREKARVMVLAGFGAPAARDVDVSGWVEAMRSEADGYVVVVYER
ncbi:MAG: malto-oligosyltrehalose trehalohydrolase [Terriglobales bacterium]